MTKKKPNKKQLLLGREAELIWSKFWETLANTYSRAFIISSSSCNASAAAVNTIKKAHLSVQSTIQATSEPCSVS